MFMLTKKMYFCAENSMKFLNTYIFLFLSLLNVYAQPQSPEKRAEAFFKNGFSEFESRNYDFALTEFKKVFSLYETPHHDPAYFYAGLCYFHKKDYEQAIKHFQKNIDKQPESKYKQEAIYHKGLCMLAQNSITSREGGLYLLMDLEEKTSNQSLKDDIKNSILSFLFRSRIFFLENYYEKVRSSYKTYVAEALAYQYHLENQKDKLNEFLNDYEKKYTLSLNLKKIKDLQNDNSNENKEKWNDTLKVAIVLPFNIKEYSDSSQAIKLINKYALEFFYGLEYGLQNKRLPNIQKVIVKTFDSQRDSNYVKLLIKKDLAEFKPNILIGEFVASNTQILSHYCELNGILQIIPFANHENLTANKKFTFLQNATLSNQTAVLAKWIANKSDYQNVVGIFDDTPDGKKSSEIFKQELEKSKINLKIQYFEHGNWQNSLNQIVKVCLDTLNLVDAVFMNIQKQEHFELLMNRLTRSDTTQFTLLTINDIKNFNRIDGKKWFYFSTIFTQFYDPNNKLNEKASIQNEVMNRYKIVPNTNFYQGIDVWEILSFALIEKYNGNSWKESFQSIKAFQGYNQNYYFGQSNSNQSIKIYQFQKNGVNQLETW